MNEDGLSNIAYFRLDGGSSKLYTQEYVDKKDKEIERLNNVINKAIEYISCHFKEMVADEEAQVLLEILKGEKHV